MRLGHLAFTFVLGACSGAPSGTPLLPTGPGNVGDPCQLDDACRKGLVCAMNKCAPSHALKDGDPCVISAECKDGDYCGPSRTCAPAGGGASGTPCSSDAECSRAPGAYLRCNLEGLGAACRAEGGVDQTQACKTNADCFGALGCWQGKCASLVQTCQADSDCRLGSCPQLTHLCIPELANPSGLVPLTIADFKGETCKDDPGATQAYFRVPRGADDGDFYRLPFPNDIRKKNGRLDLTGHPTPGSGGAGVDTFAAYLRDLERNADGFSAYPTVFFRFSNRVDFASLKQNGVVRFVDTTSGSDVGGFQWVASTAHDKYVCDNWLALQPYGALALVPGHTYAAFITTGARDMSMQPVMRAADMTAMLQGTPPSDAALTPAYAAYAPLRAWATSKMFDANTILTAAVFTVGHPERLARGVPAAVASATAPSAAQWVKCGTNPSPCPQATGERACGAPNSAFDELHALVTLPTFQNAQGGVDVDMSGVPIATGTAPVCLALSVPKGVAMPVGGWPVVVYAHDTDRSFRSFVADGIAARLAAADDGMGGKVAMAVLGIDQVDHGTRRASGDAASVLLLTEASPARARGDRVQSAADQLALLRLLATFDLPAGMSPTGNEIKLGRALFWGHGQGAVSGALAIPYSDAPAAVLSGASASVRDTMLGRQRPMSTQVVMPFVLQEALDANHPAMALLQSALDAVDPLYHATAMTIAPTGSFKPKHVFQPFAQMDTYTATSPQLTWAFAASLGVAQPPASVTAQSPALMMAGYKAVPVSGNFTLMSQMYTQIVREFAPGAEGHTIVTSDLSAMADVDHFLADAARGVVPRVGR